MDMERVGFDVAVDMPPHEAYLRWHEGGFAEEAAPVTLLSRNDNALVWRVRSEAQDFEFQSTITESEPGRRERWRGCSNEGFIEFIAQSDGRTRVVFSMQFEAGSPKADSIATTVAEVAAELGFPHR